MQHYKVIALSVGGTNNRIYKSGDIVPASGFVEENIPHLVKNKYIEAHTIGTLPKATVQSVVPPAEDTTPPPANETIVQQLTEEALQGKELAELRELATARGVEFKTNMGKAKLIELLLAAETKA